MLTSAPVRDAPEVQPQGELAAPARSERRRRLILGLVTVGVTLRLLQYLVNRSLWLDEALIASNIVDRSLAGLLEPLNYAQTAPLGFLFLEWISVQLFGPEELALRLVPLIAGIGSLLLFVRVAPTLVSNRAAPLAIALFALSPYLIYYSSEVKQYSLDVLVSVGVLGAGMLVLERGATWRRMSGLLVLGVVGVWLSQPSVFVLAGVGSVLALQALRRRDGREMGRLVGIGAAWLLSFAGSYAVSNTGLNDHEFMRAFWRPGFMPVPPRTLEDWLWVPRTVWRVFRDPLGVMDDSAVSSYPVAIAGIACFLTGSVWMLRRQRARAALLLSPLPFLLLASALKAYPIGGAFLNGGRVLLFLVPLLLLLIAEGAAQVHLRTRWAGLLVGAMLLLPPMAYAAIGVPQVRAEIKPLLGYAREQWRPGDRLYVYYDARAPFEFYRERYGFQQEDYVVGRCSRFRPEGYLQDLWRQAGAARLWVLFVGGKGAHGFDEQGLMVAYLDAAAPRLDDQIAIGASLYLYDFRDPIPVVARSPIPELPFAMEFDCRGPWAQQQQLSLSVPRSPGGSNDR